MRKHADGKEREYDRINNEGGEGYNPHRAARQEREYDRDIDRAEIAALRAERAQIEADYNMMGGHGK